MASMVKPNIATFLASAAIAKGQAVKFGADNGHVTPVTATTDKSIGVAQSVATASGDEVEVALPGGGAKGLAKTTIALGDILGHNADGSIQKVASASDRIIGVAMDSAVANDLFQMNVLVAQAVATQA